MQIDRRITNGLAWAGMFVIVAVPVADIVSAQFMDRTPAPAEATIDRVAEIPTPAAKPVVATPAAETVAVVPAKAVTPAAVVDRFLATGKPLPGYISDGDAGPVQTATVPVAPKPVQKPAVKPDPVAVAAIAPVETALAETTPAEIMPAKVAPMPMPLSMRPKPIIRQPQQDEIVLPPEMVAGNDQPMVIDDLQDWESGPLSEFLATRRSSATVTGDDRVYYSDRPRRDVYLGPVDDDPILFPLFN